jgi:hypothetical protein
MAVTLNQRAYEHARKLIDDGQFVLDDRDMWSEHRPSAQQENELIRQHGIGEHAKWYLGVDDDIPEGRKSRHKFPYGDFAKVHRCGALSAEVRAAQQGYHDIEVAAAHLHGLLDAFREAHR